MQNFRNLKVWQKAHTLTLDVYMSTQKFPKEETYGLTSQMRRAATSISANIAEGCCRKGDLELGRFLQIAMGSASEVEYHCVLAHDLGMLKPDEYDRLTSETVEVKRMLAALLGKLRADS